MWRFWYDSYIEAVKRQGFVGELEWESVLQDVLRVIEEYLVEK